MAFEVEHMNDAFPYRIAFKCLAHGHRLDKRSRYRHAGFRWLANRVQLSSDALNSYVDAVEQAFGADIDYGQAVKFYEAEPIGPGRYSPPKVVRAERTVIAGSPDVAHISTSMIERQNLTMRMSMRRFTRLTNAFSKKVENHAHMMVIYFMHYIFVRIHQTLKVTPAMAAGVTPKLWEMSDMVKVLEDWEAAD
jgi:IS1 transposase